MTRAVELGFPRDKLKRNGLLRTKMGTGFDQFLDGIPEKETAIKPVPYSMKLCNPMDRWLP
jgi:hypothetical protein